MTERINIVEAELMRIDLKPGDVLCVKFPCRLRPEAETRIRECFERHFPRNRTLVLQEGMELVVVRQPPEKSGLTLETQPIYIDTQQGIPLREQARG